MVVNATALVSPWRCEVSPADDARPRSAAPAAYQSMATDLRYSRETFETCSLPVKAGIPSLQTPKLAFATQMSNKNYRGKQTASPGYSGGKKSRRGRLSALFGRGPEEFGDSAYHPKASKNEVEPINNGLDNLSEQSGQFQESVIAHKSERNDNFTQSSNADVVATRLTADEKNIQDLDHTSVVKTPESVSFSETNQVPVVAEVPVNQSAIFQASENEFAGNDITHGVVSNLSTPSRAINLPIRRHKRASSSFKIVDKNTADAVLLPASYKAALPQNSYDRSYHKKHPGANAKMQAGPSAQSFTVSQKRDEEVQLLQSTHAVFGLSNATNQISDSGTTIVTEDTGLLPSTTYTASETLYSIPEVSRNESISAEKSHLLSSTPYIESGPAINTSQINEASVGGTHLLPSTSYAASSFLHGALKTPTFDKAHAEKKVRFAVNPSIKVDRDENEDGDSDDSDKTIKPDFGGTKTAPNPILSPLIWGKGSEPKIWLKDGKPTLFQPQQEPSYYTNPLWSRQYPEILSNDTYVNPHVARYAESTTSMDGSQYSETPAANSNTNFDMGNTFHMNTDSNTNMSFEAGTPTPRAIFTETPRGTNTSPASTNQTFVGRDFPEQPNTPTGYAHTPRYRTQVKIEVGGRRFVTTFEVLEKSPWFRHLFSIDFRNWYHDGVFHIDNDGDLFAHILRYLRTDLYPFFWDSRNGFDYVMYAMIKQQAHYYMLYDLEAWIAAQEFHEVVETQVVHRKVTVPHEQVWVHKQRLMGNHSYVISGVVNNANHITNRQRDGQSHTAGYYQSEKEESSGSKGKAKEIVTPRVDDDGTVALLTTEKIVKINMDQLRHF